jgi:acetamidase/formamidase
VLTVDPGDTVVAGSLDASGHLARQQVPGEERPKMFPAARGHCLTGPIAVRGARPGDMLAVRFVSLRPGEWGWTVAAARDTPVTRRLGLAGGPPSWLLWELDPDAGTATADRGFVRRLAPFLGVTGMPPDEPGEHSTIPPRAAGGGNIDCKELVAGSTLYLPVTVPGALLYLGDGHAAMGDGEVAGSAIEVPMHVRVQVDVIKGRKIGWPRFENEDYLMATGIYRPLEDAARIAYIELVKWVHDDYGLSEMDTYELLSKVAEVRLSEIVDPNYVVIAKINKKYLPAKKSKTR